MQRLYVYLASRSKKGIKLVTVLHGDSPPSRLHNIADLQLPQNWERQMSKLIQDNRMLYEPWLESASSYNELRDRLKKRGFENLPMGAVPLLNLSHYGQLPKADTSSCKVKTTMIRKNLNG